MCQMTSTGFLGEGSPDACDAAVWALSDLMVVAHAPLWAAISGLLFSMTLAHGGTCHVYQDGADTVQACEDPVTDQDGHRRVYGQPNAGFDRYPGQGECRCCNRGGGGGCPKWDRKRSKWDGL
jgi:hypothetical protein